MQDYRATRPKLFLDEWCAGKEGLRRMEDSPQRAEWTGDDDYFLMEERCRVGEKRKGARIGDCASVDSRGEHRMMKHDHIGELPDECLLQIFAYLPRARDRCACAAVCMRWLMLQSHMAACEFEKAEGEAGEACVGGGGWRAAAGDGQKVLDVIYEGLEEGSDEAAGEGHGEGWESADLFRGSAVGEEPRVERQPQWAMGDLSRSLEGRKASDVRLAAIAVGTAARGGLGKLSIRGACGDRVVRSVTDLGVCAIGICCAALRCLSLWHCSSVGDDGLVAIGKGCRLLQKLDMLKCPGVGDAGLRAVALGCPLLASLSIDSCDNVSDRGLISVGQSCSYLAAFCVRNCALIGDEGIAAVVTGAKMLRRLKLEKVGVGDEVLSAVAMQGNALVHLILSGLEYLSEEGFSSLGRVSRLGKLKNLLINSCRGLTDVALVEIGQGCPDLKRLVLRDCAGVGDEGLQGFTRLCSSLESLHVMRCQGITCVGLIALLSFGGTHLKSLQLSKCYGITDAGFCAESFAVPCEFLTSLSLSGCKGIGDRCLELIAHSCPSLENLDLSGLCGVSDSGVMAAVSSCQQTLVGLNLSGCCKVSDRAVCDITKSCGRHLRSLTLNGCQKVTDVSLKVIAEECLELKDLDVSRCSITDEGVYAVVATRGQGLQSLSLESCMDITDECLPFIEKDCEFLWGLNLKHCEGLSRGALDSFEARLFRCDLICS